MHLKEETLFSSTQWSIIDADCKSNLVVVLLKGKGENIVQINGPTGFSKIRFITEGFLENNTCNT